MSRLTIKVILTVFLLVTITGCASVPHTTFDPEPVQTDTQSRTKAVLWTIGTILVVGAILVNQVEDDVRDTLRQVSPP